MPDIHLYRDEKLNDSWNLRIQQYIKCTGYQHPPSDSVHMLDLQIFPLGFAHILLSLRVSPDVNTDKPKQEFPALT